jgi:hypothetical protein
VTILSPRFMKHLKHLILSLLLLATFPVRAEPPGISQSSELFTAPAGGKFLRWYGHSGRSYFMQVSDSNDPLNKWSWAPIIESGNNEEISYEVDGTADKGFFRLKHTDQLPGPGETLDTADFDRDGLSNIGEIAPASPLQSTDPLDGDTDSDGLKDGWERANGFDPNDNGTTNPANGANGDPDGDGVPNLTESQGSTNPQDSNDFPLEWYYVTNRLDGISSYTSTTPERGTFTYSPWNKSDMPPKDITGRLLPSMMADEVATLSFPATAMQAIQESPDNVKTIEIDWGEYASGHAHFYKFSAPPPYGNGFSFGTYLNTRSWIHAPAKPTERDLPFVKMVRVTRSRSETFSSEVTQADLVTVHIPANQTYSEAVDLSTTTLSEDLVTHTSMIKLQRVSIVPADNMAGVIGDVVESVMPGSEIKHFVTPKKTAELSQDYVELIATGVDATVFDQVLQWEGGEAGGASNTRRVKRDAAGKTEVKLLPKNGSGAVCQMNVWVVWCDVTTTSGLASFGNFMGGAIYEVSQQPTEGWRFVFKIQPASILDQATQERPKLSGVKRKDPPGAGSVYTIKPYLKAGDTATKQWDVSRQYQLTIRNSGGIPKVDLEQGGVASAWIKNQPAVADTPVPFPSSDVEGNDDPLVSDEDVNPYAMKTNDPKLNHQQGELSSCDAPFLRVLDLWGEAGRSYAVEYNFKEFARVELWDGKRTSGPFWFRISDHVKWHHYLDSIYDNAAVQWKDASSSSGIDHPKP